MISTACHYPAPVYRHAKLQGGAVFQKGQHCRHKSAARRSRMAALRLPKWVSGLAQMKPMSSPTTSKWHGFAGRHTEALNAHHIERGGTPLPPETDGAVSRSDHLTPPSAKVCGWTEPASNHGEVGLQLGQDECKASWLPLESTACTEGTAAGKPQGSRCQCNRRRSSDRSCGAIA